MALIVSLFLVILIAAGGVLIWEARTGRFTSGSRRRDAWRGALFFLSTVVGSAFLIRSAGGAILLAAAFVPVTVLSLMRLVTLARARWAGAATSFVLALALVLGTAASLAALPGPLDRGLFLERILHPDRTGFPPSIDPDARRPVRL